MKKQHSVSAILTTGAMTATVALLAGMGLANAQAPVPGPPLSGAGSFPQSFIVPGTNTSLHVGGQIQIDAGYGMDSFGASSSQGAYDNLTPGSVAVEGPGAPGSPSHTNHGTLRFTGDNSKLFTETRTATPYGEMKTYIEFDFNGGVATATTTAGGSSTTKLGDDGTPRLRQAYGTLGPWLFGKAVSNYADLAALADTLDAPVEAGSFMGAGTFRQTQVRYTYLLPAGISLSGSVESAFSAGVIAFDATGHGGAQSNWNNFNAPGVSQRIPAFTGKAMIEQPWGHAAFAAAVMQERFDNDSGAAPFTTGGGGGTAPIATGGHFARWGFQTALTGHLNTIGQDKFTWQAGYGQGAAQYSWALVGPDLGTNYEEGLVCSQQGPSSFNCSEPRVFGFNVGYSHFWTNEWRSGVGLGWDDVSRPNAAGAWTAAGLSKIDHRHYSGSASLFWTPVAGAQFGATYIWYHREVWSGARGNAQRLETQALFRF
jgi:hypothetical protein